MPEAPATSIANASAHAAAKGVDALIAMAASYDLDATCEHFYFLRHGQTPCNASRIFQGPDEPLSDLGVRQAKAAAGVLASHSIATIVCSSMRRAQQTAALVASEHAMTPVDHSGVRERHFGALIGTSSAQIDWACAPEGGETLAAFVARTCLGLNQALAHASPTLVVAHGGTLYVLTALLGLGVDPRLIGNAHPLLFSRRDNSWAVTALVPVQIDAGSAANLA